jgi:hypothetical protein
MPHATYTTATETPDWYFANFPDKTIIEICSAAYAEWEEIVQEAETSFRVNLS